jgi:hypothetical protein
MKQLLITITLLFSIVYANGQAPQSFNFQGIARDASGNPIVSTTISIRSSVLSSSATGTVEYSEIQNPVTNQFGLFTIAIGANGFLNVPASSYTAAQLDDNSTAIGGDFFGKNGGENYLRSFWGYVIDRNNGNLGYNNGSYSSGTLPDGGMVVLLLYDIERLQRLLEQIL